MNLLQVYYQKDLGPILTSEFKRLTIKDILASHDFARIGTLSVPDPETAFTILQDSHPLVPKIRSLGINHTTMSVGDCLISEDESKCWVCDTFGWIEIN